VKVFVESGGGCGIPLEWVVEAVLFMLKTGVFAVIGKVDVGIPGFGWGMLLGWYWGGGGGGKGEVLVLFFNGSGTVGVHIAEGLNWGVSKHVLVDRKPVWDGQGGRGRGRWHWGGGFGGCSLTFLIGFVVVRVVEGFQWAGSHARFGGREMGAGGGAYECERGGEGGGMRIWNGPDI
jgi:hypothetical protein